MSKTPQLSSVTAMNHLAQIGDALRANRTLGRVPPSALVWPAGLDRSILQTLPLSVRTWNCLIGARLIEGDSQLRAVELLHLPNFGNKSLWDLLNNVETFLLDCAWKTGSESTDYSTQTEPSPWVRCGESLLPLLATSAELLGTKTLAEALHPDLLRLASRMGLSPELQATRVHDVANRAQSLPMRVAARLERVLEAARDRHHTIIQMRLVQAPPATLDDVGRQFGITRERVRQIQSKYERRIEAALGNELEVIAATLKNEFDPIVPKADLERRIDDIVPKGAPLVYDLFRRALILAMEFTLNDEFYIDAHAAEVLRNLPARARPLADDVGLVQEQRLVETLPNEGWQRFWPWLCERGGFHDLHGILALRDTNRARVKAALMSIGHPATREEIAAVCGFEESRTVGATLSNIPSVARADKDRWGLREWIDDEYDGIAGEIIQRIEEDGGATTTERLLTELPSKFNVSPASVRAYMQTARFMIRNGSISLASASAVRLRHLDDVIHGRDDSGAPYWTFVVENRYFEGHSALGVPPEFAKALGCNPDSSLGIRIRNIAGCRNLSLRWRLTSLAGASLGYLSEPLCQLGLQPGDHARVTIRDTGLVDLSAQDAGAETQRPGVADAALERILHRRRSLS